MLEEGAEFILDDNPKTGDVKRAYLRITKCLARSNPAIACW